ncbi:hypothetical protein SESBI_37212 [Sesbania bispinosa]|nr:hypothetical protein SESBI_37212 [Sesbania bispinosa]
MHDSRENGGEDTAEESINDEEGDDDKDKDGGGGGSGDPIIMLPLNPFLLSYSSSLSNNHPWKSFLPRKVLRPAPLPTWKVVGKMMGVSFQERHT